MDALEQLEEDKIVRWRTRNELAIEQSRRGESAPLDEQVILENLRKRLVEEGVFEKYGTKEESGVCSRTRWRE